MVKIDKSFKKDTKNKTIPQKNSLEKSRKESSTSAPKTERPSTEAVPNTEHSESQESARGKYIRGESQKPVTKEYRNNWNRIFK